MIREISISNKKIGDAHPVFVIAEIGVNHNGDLQLAKEMVYKAKEAGADCVKFQTFKASNIVTKNAPKAKYQITSTATEQTQMEMLKSLELSYQDHIDLFELCKNLDIVFLSTPYAIEDIDFLDELGVNAYKLASIHIVEPFFLEYAASKNKPMILSTGMATIDEVITAVEKVRARGNNNIALLQCTTCYPALPEEANLLVIKEFRKKLEIIAGYSDHTPGNICSLLSVALGGCIIEKHFTLDKDLPGPDQKTSIEPHELSELVNSIRTAQHALGNGLKKPTLGELENINIMRRSLVTTRKISRGERIGITDLVAKRPGGGISPASIYNVIDREALCDLEKDQILSWDECGE